MDTKTPGRGGLLVMAIGLAAFSTACTNQTSPPVATHHTTNGHTEPVVIPPHGTPAWNQIVESRLKITDAAGHGPDLGSTEWQGAVSKKAGLAAGLPPGTEAWYRAVDAKVFSPR